MQNYQLNYRVPQIFSPVNNVFVSYTMTSITFVPNTSILTTTNASLWVQVSQNGVLKNVTFAATNQDASIVVPEVYNPYTTDKRVLLTGMRVPVTIITAVGWAAVYARFVSVSNMTNILDAKIGETNICSKKI